MRILFILAICFANLITHGQDHSVLGSNGGFFFSSNGSLEWTLGELSTETYSKSIGILTQGFHQSKLDQVTGLEETDNYIFVYPNPVQKSLNLKITESGSYGVELFTLMGQRVTNENFTSSDAVQIHTIEVFNLNAAIYFLYIKNSATGKKHFFKIVKF
jgi:hypothetical protein